MKRKNIPTDIKSKSLNETKSEISDILERLENNKVDLEASKKDYERLLILNDHIDNLFKEKLNNIKSIELKNKTS
ncbi:MAG: hypothetical protein CBD56_02430 [Candidatus Pelagibacter sp. TMED196]|nr:MAG: hypothetical protein CBD56_02430 [Candidatus Pelagibacter sp. TMED196]|tara:strand:- start:16 stop:240 length:225 start_codon:yes stop_codon:yes gene_type:complete